MRWFVVVVVLLSSGSASAGTYIEMAQKELGDAGAKAKTNKLWADGGRLRLDTDDGKNTVIFKNETMYAVDHAKKRVAVIDKQTVEQMGAQMAQAQEQMKERMAQMPPEQRAQIEKMMAQHGGAMGPMAGNPPPPRTFKQTSRTDTVAGKSCTVWEAYDGSKKEQELCVAAPGSVAGSGDVIAALKDMSKLFEKMASGFGGRDRMAQTWMQLDQLKGFPVLTRDFDEGKATREQRLITSRVESVPSTSFDPPAGYTVEKPGAGRGGARGQMPPQPGVE